MRHGWDGGEGSGRAGREGYSLSIATVKVVTLEVSGDVICSRQLQSILVHTPAQAALSAPGWLALFPFVESFPVTVRKVDGTGDHSLARFEFLK